MNKESQADSAETPDTEFRRSWSRRLADALFGYDFFISYAHADGRAYAVSLARGLETKGFDVFLDSERYLWGDDWKRIGAWALKRTNRLVLVGTPKALESKPVHRELEIYTRTDKRVIPIDIGGYLSRLAPEHPVAALLEDSVLRLPEAAERCGIGPTDGVLAELNRTFEGERQQAKRSRWIRWTAAALLFLTVMLAWATWRAVREREAAIRSAVLSHARALAAQALYYANSRLDLCLLLGGQAVRMDNNFETRNALFTVLIDNPGIRKFLHGQGAAKNDEIGFSGDGRLLAAGMGNQVVVWNADTGSIAYTLNPPKSSDGASLPSRRVTGEKSAQITSVKFHPKWKLIVAGNTEGEIIAWQLEGAQIGSGALKTLLSRVNDVTFSPDGRFLAIGGEPGGVFVRGDNGILASGQPGLVVYRLGNPADVPWSDKPIKVHGDLGVVVSQAFNPAGDVLVTAGIDGNLNVWDVRGSSVWPRLDVPVLWHRALNSMSAIRELGAIPATPISEGLRSLAFSPNGKHVASGSVDGGLLLWDAQTWQHGEFQRHDGAIESLAFSPDGTQLASCEQSGTVRLWRVGRPMNLEKTWSEHRSGTLSALAFQKAARSLLACRSRDTISLWEVGQKSTPPIARVLGVHEAVASVGYCATSGLVVTVGSRVERDLSDYSTHGSICLWDLNHSGDPIRTQVDKRLDAFSGAAFDESGTMLVVEGNYEVTMWSLPSLGRLSQKDVVISNLNPRSSATRVRLVSDPSGVRTAKEDAEALTLLRRLREQRQSSSSSEKSPLEDTSCATVCRMLGLRVLATGRQDGRVVLWDSEKLKPLGRPLPGHQGPVQDMVFVEPKQILVSVGGDQVIVWNLDLEAQARGIANRELNASEVEQFLSRRR